jgi:hypothetical protein
LLNNAHLIIYSFVLYISGKVPKEAELKSMIEEAPGPINFTMLLTLFGDRLNGKLTTFIKIILAETKMPQNIA